MDVPEIVASVHQLFWGNHWLQRATPTVYPQNNPIWQCYWKKQQVVGTPPLHIRSHTHLMSKYVSNYVQAFPCSICIRVYLYKYMCICMPFLISNSRGYWLRIMDDKWWQFNVRLSLAIKWQSSYKSIVVINPVMMAIKYFDEQW